MRLPDSGDPTSLELNWIEHKECGRCALVIGSKSHIHIAFTLGCRGGGGFRLYLPQTWTDLDETWNKSEKSWCALTQKIKGNHPGVPPKDAKMCFYVINTIRTFGHLSGTNFDHFWNKRRESVYACVNRWKISEFLRRLFYRSPKQPKMGTFEGCLW